MELAHKLFYKKDFFHRLIVEITETSVIKDLKSANFFIKMLKKLGCRISVDDFGSDTVLFLSLSILRLIVLKLERITSKICLKTKRRSIYRDTC